MEKIHNSKIELGRFYGKSELANAYGLGSWRSLKSHLSDDLQQEISKLGNIKSLKPNVVKLIYDECNKIKFED